MESETRPMPKSVFGLRSMIFAYKIILAHLVSVKTDFAKGGKNGGEIASAADSLRIAGN